MAGITPYCKFMKSDSESISEHSCGVNDKYCSIIENTIDAIITIALDGRITGWNSGAEALYHYSADEILGKPYPIVPDYLKDEFFKIINKMKSGKVVPDYEAQRVNKEGKILDVSISFFPIKDKLGKITEFCAIHRDITERKRLQDEMMRAKELAMIGQLAAGIAHALNTPLASILISAQMVKEDLITDSSKNDIDRIERQTEKCKVIVRNLLNLSRPASAVREPSDIQKLIIQVIQGIEPTLKERNIKLVLDMDNRKAMISCDPRMIEEMITNLISNAGDAIHNNGTITVTVRTDREEITIKINDTGKGIQPEHLSKIFDPFFTTKEIGKGTGLGLALCHRIVHDHKGKISAESNPNKGTTFTIVLPLESSDTPLPLPALESL